MRKELLLSDDVEPVSRVDQTVSRLLADSDGDVGVLGAFIVGELRIVAAVLERCTAVLRNSSDGRLSSS